MTAAKCTMARGATSLTSLVTASGCVRSDHRTSTASPSAAAALRLAATSRSVATTRWPAPVSCFTTSLPTSPNAPVTSTRLGGGTPVLLTCAADQELIGCMYDISVCVTVDTTVYHEVNPTE